MCTPIPHGGFGVDYVSKLWPHEKLSIAAAGSGTEEEDPSGPLVAVVP
jgi:hypothetical protein